MDIPREYESDTSPSTQYKIGEISNAFNAPTQDTNTHLSRENPSLRVLLDVFGPSEAGGGVEGNSR